MFAPPKIWTVSVYMELWHMHEKNALKCNSMISSFVSDTMSSYVSSRFSMSRAPSVAPDSRSRAPSQVIWIISLLSHNDLRPQALDIGQVRRPPQHPSKRWSSVLEYGSERYVLMGYVKSTWLKKNLYFRPVRYESLPPTTHTTRARTPGLPSYNEALLKSSQRLRERSMSPSRGAPGVNVEK